MRSVGGVGVRWSGCGGVRRELVALHAEATICVWEMQEHLCASAVLRSRRET